MKVFLVRNTVLALLLLISFLTFTPARSDGIKIEWTPPALFTDEATLVVQNAKHYPQVLKIDLFNDDNRNEPVANALVTLPPNSKITERIKPIAGKTIKQSVYWYYVRGIGDFTKSEDANGYKIPFASDIQALICQYPHGNDPAIDFCVPKGTSVRAAKAGTVIWTVDEHGDGGPDIKFAGKANLVEVVHDDGSRALYAHLQKGTITVKAGDVVFAGDIIGEVGISGQTSGPHLHFHVVKLNQSMQDTFIEPKFTTSDGKPLFFKRQYTVSQNTSTQGFQERPSSEAFKATARESNSSAQTVGELDQETFICESLKDQPMCGSTTKLVIKGNVLHEIKGEKTWASFYRDETDTSAKIRFLGLDQARGIYLKIEQHDTDKYTAFWAWKARSYSQTVWTLIPGTFSRVNETADKSPTVSRDKEQTLCGQGLATENEKALDCLRKNQAAKAIVHLINHTKKSPNDGLALARLATAYTGLGRHDEAIVAYKNALAKNWISYDFAAHYSNSLFAVGNREEAVKWGYRSIKLAPDCLTCRSDLATKLKDLGRSAEALKLLTDYNESQKSKGKKEHFQGLIMLLEDEAASQKNR